MEYFSQLCYIIAMADKILLHCCCGPCTTASAERLLSEGFSPILYFSNSNIMSLEEFQKREESMAVVARYFNIPLEVDPWNSYPWEKAVRGLEHEPEGGSRCRLCFRFNLERSARKASKLGIPYTTTLTVSPHKSSPVIFEEGKRSGDFQEHNFKKKDGFRRSITLSKELMLYRQNFCGCRFSIRN